MDDRDMPTGGSRGKPDNSIDIDEVNAELSRARHLIDLTDVWMNENAVGNVPPAVDGAWLHHADLMRERLERLDQLINGARS